MDNPNSSELIISNKEISSSSENSTLSKESPANSEVGKTSEDVSDTSEICFSNKETISGSELVSQTKKSSGRSEKGIISISEISNMMVLPSEILAAIFQYLDLDSRLHFR
jgi:hypothetical protein